MQFKATTRTPYRLPSPPAFAGGGVALIVLVIGSLWLAESPEPVRSPAPVALPRLAAAITPRPAHPQPSRPVYRHSVIPGGVHGAAELASSLARDPVASIHYANFDVARASMVKVGKPRLVHVSYRVGDKIYWTKNTVLLAAGEELLTDGIHLVRARCGNRIADARQAIESDHEPAPEVLDALMVSADDLPDGTGKPANTSGGVTNGVTNSVTNSVTNFSAPATILLASSVQAAAPFPARAAPDLVSLDTTLHTTWRTSVPASPPTPAQAAPAQPGHGDDDVPAAAGSAPPSTPATPVVTLAGPLAHSGEPAAAATQARPAADTDTAAPIPEPGSAALALAALVALSLARRGAISRK